MHTPPLQLNPAQQPAVAPQGRPGPAQLEPPHWPLLHTVPAGQTLPQLPQLAESDWVLKQPPPHTVVAGGQLTPPSAPEPHEPLLHESPAGHT